MTEKIKKPDCYGLLYDADACSECELAGECKTAMTAADATAAETVDANTPADAPDETEQKAEVEAEKETEAEAKAEAELEAEAKAEAEARAELEAEKAKAKPEPKKKAAKAKKEKKAVVIENRPPFKNLMKEGKIAAINEDNGKTYMQVDGKHIYKSQIYHEKNLKAYAEEGANPFKEGSLPAEAFDFLKQGKEITFRDTFEYLKAAHPDAKESTLMNRAADVLSGAHFFGIAKITRKEGRQRYFQIQD